jgi:hypothetical protein
MLNDITEIKKISRGSLLKPKPILRIGISEHADSRLEIFKNIMSFSTQNLGWTPCVQRIWGFYQRHKFDELQQHILSLHITEALPSPRSLAFFVESRRQSG